MMRRLLIVLAIFALTGCEPYRFSMGEGNVIGAKIRSPLHTVDKGKFRATVRDTGIISFGRYGVTQFHTTFQLRLDRGEGAILSSRGMVRDHIFDRGISLRFDRDGVEIDSSGKPLRTIAGVGFAQDSLLDVHVFSDAHIFQVVADCDTLIRMRYLRSMEPDEMLLQALPNSEVTMINPVWEYLPWFD
ncbi:MAG TPA: hypothetical protein VFH43_12120 [Candidatus Kapabacteria bacterium]|jgi:hypothetical protein|nr:hypothetical protein [Candidatus Kapabacteria bacterium]